MSRVVNEKNAAAKAVANGGQLASDWFSVQGDQQSADTWVVCSHVRVPKGSFAQSRVFGHLGGAKVFFNAPRNGWYGEGVPGVGDSLPAIVSWLRDVIDGRDNTKLSFVGHSMGAHLAIALSTFFEGASFVITSPELLTGRPGARSVQNGVTNRHPYGDLYRFMPHRAASSRSLCVFGLYDRIDAYFLGRDQTYSPRFGKIYAAPHHHGVTEYLTANRYYLSLLSNRTAYADALVRQGGLHAAPPPEERRRLWHFAALGEAVATADVKRACKLQSGQGDWSNAGWNSERATVFHRMGEQAQAVEAARAAVEVAPSIPEYALQLARLASRAGNDDAVKVAERAMRETCPPHRAVEQYFKQK